MARNYHIPLYPGNCYHIFNHGNAEENLFRSHENYTYFLEKYGAYIYPVAVTYAYCLMPNHFHFLLEVRNEEHIRAGIKKNNKPIEILPGQQFSNFFNAYTKAFNKRYGRSGKLFRLPFNRVRIDSYGQFLNTFNYIHYNPCHHGFVKDPMDWHFSSVHAYENWSMPSKIGREEAQERLRGNINLRPTAEILDMEYFIDIPC